MIEKIIKTMTNAKQSTMIIWTCSVINFTKLYFALPWRRNNL